MEAATELPPPPIPPGALQQFHEPALQPAFTPYPNQSHVSGQNYDRNSNNTGSIPPPPPAMSDIIPPPTEVIPIPPALPQDTSQPPIQQDPAQPPNIPGEQGNNQNSNQERRSESDDGSGSGSGSGSEHSESEDEPEQEGDGFQWDPVPEDPSAPCEDEMKIIEQRGEHSALDYEYWEKKAYFDPNDPEIVPGESGRIDWLVEHFNGTKDNPNKVQVMTSQTMSIGGYDWRIKFYPRGNDSDFLSAYVECVTMQSEDFQASEDFAHPPLPFITGMDKQKKRRSVAAQVQIVMYNPAEPRVYHYRHDAHQFTKDLADHGWKCFTRYPRRDFAFRMHGQRQAILRDDKLAFSAYIRLVHDPTGYTWSHSTDPFTDSVALTGLRPFSPQMPLFAAQLPLLHFAPFRNFISKFGSNTKIVFWFQTLLWKCLSRKRSEFYGQHEVYVASDTVAWLRYNVKWLKKETDAGVIEQLLGSLDPAQGAAVCGNRLKTAKVSSIQAAVNAHPTALETPALLTLELERQEFQRDKRKWHKLTNKVEMEDQITVAGINYTLFAFATHNVDLESNKYNLYVRPQGPASQWYQYTEGSVKCLTRKQSVDKCSGIELPKEAEKEKHSYRHDPFRNLTDRLEVAHVAYYVREDATSLAFAAPTEEAWDVPENVKKGVPPTYDGVVEDKPPATAMYEQFGESVSDDPQPPEPPAEVQPPAVEEEPPRRSSFGIDAGYATPNCWQMDGDDVVMSDADEEASNDDHEKVPEDQLTMQTIDHMGREYFQGEMLGHRYYGQGHLIAMSGDEYKGSFKDGKKHGRGTMTYALTGNIYDGEWEENEHHGQGTLTELKTGNVFDGGWRHGKKHGHFVLKGTVTEEDKGCCSICYDKEITTAFYACGHVVACRDCADRVDHCPVCRKPVSGRLQLFGVKLTFE